MIGAIVARNKTTKAMQALNRKDLTAFLADYADDAVQLFPGEQPAPPCPGRIDLEHV